MYFALDGYFKLRFFEKELPYAEIIESHFGNCDIRVYIVARAIIDTILQKIFVIVDGGITSGGIRELLTLENSSSRLKVVTREIFEMVVSNVAMGLSFCQVAGVAQVVRVSRQWAMTALKEGTVRQMVLIFIAVNLKKIQTP